MTASTGQLGIACTIVVVSILIAGLASWGGRLYRYLNSGLTRTVDEHRDYCEKHGQE